MNLNWKETSHAIPDSWLVMESPRSLGVNSQSGVQALMVGLWQRG
jgi:hypothetical protein